MAISIDIVANPNPSLCAVRATGYEEHVITDEEIATFGVGDSRLKAAVAAHFALAPNDAFLRSPTPWGDLYTTYGWQVVKTVLTVQDARILEATSRPVIVKTQEFVNNSSTRGTYSTSISETLTNTVSTNWSRGGNLTVGGKIATKVQVPGVGEASSELSISHSDTWGIGGATTQAVTVGSTSGVAVELKPGEAKVAELSANRGVLKVRVTYKAHLTGGTAVNYNPTYRDHHFWYFPIATVMAAGGIANSVIRTQDIEVDYFSDSKILMKDKETGTEASCAEIAKTRPEAPDGEYTIRAQGRSFAVYCHDMKGTPREFLTLKETGPGVNCSTYAAGPNTSPGGVTTCYTKIRLHPETFTVDIRDTTFATSDSGVWRSGPLEYRWVSYATAADCVGRRSQSGRANINLKGTPFALSAGQFSATGWEPAGTADVSADGRTASLLGGGYCGAMEPPNGVLRLVFVGT